MKAFIPFLIFLLAGCGYRFGAGPCCTKNCLVTISVPYVEGDVDGAITDAIVRELSGCNQFQYVNCEGDIVLKAYVLSDDRDEIGYQYDRDEITGKRVNRLAPNEERRSIRLEFSLVSGMTGETICGPYYITGSTDYDFVISYSLKDVSFINPSGVRTRTLFFSLGQLDANEGAYDSASIPLYRRLAKKLTEGICALNF